MPRIRVKNTKGEYKCAARFFNPEKFEKEEEPTHLKFRRKQLEHRQKMMRATAVSQTITPHEVEPVYACPIKKCPDTDESTEEFEKDSSEHTSKMMLNLKRAISGLP